MLYEYEHTQPATLGRVLIAGLLVAIAGFAILRLAKGDPPQDAIVGFVAPAAVLSIILALFHSLTVCVSSNEIALAFGIGLIRKSFPVVEIESAAIVRNRWYHGWGIRMLRSGWLYNVSGYDAIEIQLKNGRRYRIGTDQPQELLAAVESVTAIAL